MPQKTPDDLRRALREKKLEPLYLLHGTEDFQRDIAARTVTDLALRGAPLREFNDISYSLANTEVSQAIAAAEQLPMLAARRVVRLTEAHKVNESDEETILRYLARPVDSSIVVFVADELDKRRRLTKALLEHCYAVEFPRLKGRELSEWVKKRVRELKSAMDDRTLTHFINLVGDDLRTLTNELQKLATAALPSNVITWELVEELTGRSRELSNFELTDYLLARNRKSAWRTLQQLFEDKAEPLMLLGLLSSQYHRLLLGKELLNANAPHDELFRQISMPYSKREEFLATVKRASVGQLTHSLQSIAAADFAIKTSQGTPRLQLEMLVAELTR